MIEPPEPTHVFGYVLTFPDGLKDYQPVDIGSSEQCLAALKAMPPDYVVERAPDTAIEHFLLTLEDFEQIQKDTAA